MSHTTQEAVLAELDRIRTRQRRMFPQAQYPNGTRAPATRGEIPLPVAPPRMPVTWASILREQVIEALEHQDRAELREELLQVAAVAIAWIEDLDTRS